MIPARTERLPWREVEGRAVILQPGKGEVHELNEAGTFLWALLDGSRATDDLERRLCEEFEVEESAARSDVKEFLNFLDEKGLLRWNHQ